MSRYFDVDVMVLAKNPLIPSEVHKIKVTFQREYTEGQSYKSPMVFKPIC